MSTALEKKKRKSKTEIEDDLSPRWAIFVDLRLQGVNAYQAALQAGFSDEYAKVITSRYPEKVIKSLKDALEKKGITSELIAEKIGVLLDADEYQSIDKGITHAVKIGIGGGYAPEKSVVAHFEIPVSPRLKKIAEQLNEG